MVGPMSVQADSQKVRAEPAFSSILCGVDGSRPGFEAARQAAVLAGADTPLTYAAITWEAGVGATAVATLSRRHADEVLRRVRDEARELGTTATVSRHEAADPARGLIELAAGHGLLVVGIRGHSRVPVFVVGNVATTAVHRSPIPVLAARRPPAGATFPESILVAVDETPEAHVATEVAARIARRHDSRVAIIAAPARDAAQRRALAEDAATVVAATGLEPIVLEEHGRPARSVAGAAAELGASLVVCGSRGLEGLAALASVSERIAQAALCSVLVVRRA